MLLLMLLLLLRNCCCVQVLPAVLVGLAADDMTVKCEAVAALQVCGKHRCLWTV
jgi:hypothetical protein